MDEVEYLNQRIGKTLQGKWTLERLLGWGGMAAVYVGVHHIGRRDAIKILHADVAASPEVRARFKQEAHAVNLLRHPGAVEVRDFDFTEEGCPFLVMELLEGETLAKRIERQGILPLETLLPVIDQILEVLAAAHDQQIIHRDIKPDNVFLLNNGNVKVLDFGVARVLEGAGRVVRTRLGMALGTLTYMPPEQATGVAVDGRADLFTVGGTMFRALSLKRLHEGETDADVLIKMATLPAPSLATVAPNVPRDVCLVVDRALAFNRDQRYPDARTMQADVRALMRREAPPWATARAIDNPFRPPELAADHPFRPQAPEPVPPSDPPSSDSRISYDNPTSMSFAGKASTLADDTRTAASKSAPVAALTGLHNGGSGADEAPTRAEVFAPEVPVWPSDPPPPSQGVIKTLSETIDSPPERHAAPAIPGSSAPAARSANTSNLRLPIALLFVGAAQLVALVLGALGLLYWMGDDDVDPQPLPNAHRSSIPETQLTAPGAEAVAPPRTGGAARTPDPARFAPPPGTKPSTPSTANPPPATAGTPPTLTPPLTNTSLIPPWPTLIPPTATVPATPPPGGGDSNSDDGKGKGKGKKKKDK